MVSKIQQVQDAPKESVSIKNLNDTEESVPDASPDAGFTKVDWWKATITMLPRLEKIYTEMWKPTIGLLKKKSESIPIPYDTFEKHCTKIRLIHGLSLMLFGGYWVTLAMLISFWEVHHVYHFVTKIKECGLGVDMGSRLNSLHELWILAILWYAIWSVPLLSVVTAAFMLEKYITGTIINPAIMTQLEECLPFLKVLGRWSPFIIQVSIRLVLIILSSFSYKFQVCLVMGCVGYDRLYSSLPVGVRKQIYGIKGPFKLDGKASTLWASAFVCSLWQCWNGYEFSLLGIFVPLGFLNRETKIKDN